MDDHGIRDAADVSLDAVFARMFALAPDAIVVTDKSRRVIAANARATQVFGYGVEDFLTMPVRKLFSASADWARIENLFLGSGDRVPPCGRRFLAALQTKAEEAFDGDVTLTPLTNGDGVVFATLCSFQITQNSLDDNPNSSSPYDSDDIQHFARGIGHDLKNVFAIIIGNTQLASGLARSPKQKRFLAESELASAMGARLAERLTAFAGNLQLSPERIALAAFISAQRPLLERAAGAGVVVRTNQADVRLEIFADRSGLENALLNLVENARDAMRSTGTITIEIRAWTQPPISDGAAAISDRFAAISVVDTGIGMTPWIAKRAFDPFFTTKARGDGMGLATVMGFARQCGGNAMIESVPRQGTSVILVLPRAPTV